LDIFCFVLGYVHQVKAIYDGRKSKENQIDI